MTSIATPAPLAVTINVSTFADGERWGKVAAERVRVDFAGAGSVEAGRQVYDPLWDGPYAQPADPRDWQAMRTGDATPKLASAVSGLRDAIAGLDLLRVPPASWDARQYATVHVTYAERPVGADHLRPYQERDGRWTVPMRTSVEDLFVDPQLGAIVDAARAVAAAAR